MTTAIKKAYPYHIEIPRHDGNAKNRRRYRRFVRRYGDRGIAEAINTRRLLREYRDQFMIMTGKRQGIFARAWNTLTWAFVCLK